MGRQRESVVREEGRGGKGERRGFAVEIGFTELISQLTDRGSLLASPHAARDGFHMGNRHQTFH